MGIQKVKGTRDFYPEEKVVQNYIFDTWKSIALKYGYKEIEGPILEPIEIYKKSGEEIPEQMYLLKDKSGRELALRPETTPTIARMIESKKGLIKPIKWFSISRCFRYEAPQSGRSREFSSFNLDLLGTKSIASDAEVISTLIEILKAFNCDKNDFYIRISNRKLTQSLLENLGIKKIKEVSRLLDKICKISEKDLKLSLKDIGLTEGQVKNLLKLLTITDIKKIDRSQLNEKGKEGLEELKELFNYLSKYKDYIKLDLSIMRGFDYYTGTVFEAFDKKGEFRAIAGGGRYDELAEGCPGVGYGMGDVVLELFLEARKKIPKLDYNIDYYIAPVNKKVIKESLDIANKLRTKFNVEMDVMERSLGKQMEYANSIKVKKVIIVGEKDLKEGKVTVKDMKTGKESKIKLKDL